MLKKVYATLTDLDKQEIANTFYLLSEDELAAKYNVSKTNISHVITASLRRKVNRNMCVAEMAQREPYWNSEQEMIIQDYRVEDLVGDEKIIFEGL